MNLQNWFLRQLAEKKLIEFKYDYYTDNEKETYNYQQEELRKLEDGDEIKPPWNYGGNDTFYLRSWDGCWKQGMGEWWICNIWHPFWGKLSEEDKRTYLEKHEAPPEDWYQELVAAEAIGNTDKWEWLNKQKQSLSEKKEIKPPWMTFPISLPTIGWDFYFLKLWKLEVWIPFWDSLNTEEKTAYLGKWKPPNREWEENITKHWTGKIRKTEDWFERQKLFVERQDYYGAEPILLPWVEFPKIASKETSWDEKFIDRWIREIWLPYWNNLSEEEQDNELKILKPAEFPDEIQYRMLEKYQIKNLHKFKKNDFDKEVMK